MEPARVRIWSGMQSVPKQCKPVKAQWSNFFSLARAFLHFVNALLLFLPPITSSDAPIKRTSLSVSPNSTDALLRGKSYSLGGNRTNNLLRVFFRLVLGAITKPRKGLGKLLSPCDRNLHFTPIVKEEAICILMRFCLVLRSLINKELKVSISFLSLSL